MNLCICICICSVLFIFQFDHGGKKGVVLRFAFAEIEFAKGFDNDIMTATKRKPFKCSSRWLHPDLLKFDGVISQESQHAQQNKQQFQPNQHLAAKNLLSITIDDLELLTCCQTLFSCCIEAKRHSYMANQFNKVR